LLYLFDWAVLNSSVTWKAPGCCCCKWMEGCKLISDYSNVEVNSANFRLPTIANYSCLRHFLYDYIINNNYSDW
jgi:hypothetical protein